MAFIFQPMNEVHARTLIDWRYEPPYDIYNLSPDDEADIDFFIDPQTGHYSMTNEQGELLAFCCFGREGQVPGGDYSTDALDIGLGVRPDLTGQGRGALFVNAVLDFARRTFSPPMFRVTVAEFNQRALRVWTKAGFRPVQTFSREPDGLTFVVLIREV